MNCRKNFVDGWEGGGAALTAYFRGQKVLDIWGGYADAQAARKWQMVSATIKTFNFSPKFCGSSGIARRKFLLLIKYIVDDFERMIMRKAFVLNY